MMFEFCGQGMIKTTLSFSFASKFCWDKFEWWSTKIVCDADWEASNWKIQIQNYF